MGLFKRNSQPDAQSTLFQMKADMLTLARNTAEAAGRAPTLEDYRLACAAQPETPEWNAAIYADLSNQDLQGFQLSDPNLGKPHEKAMANVYDQYGTGTVDRFYDGIKFIGADLSKTFIDPATSFNEEIAKAKSLEGIQFNGMENGDVFTFRGEAEYNNIKLTGVNGGEIRFGENARVSDLKIDGLQASIALGENAFASHVSMNDGFRILNIEAAQGAKLSNSDLSNTTISMASNLQGAVFDRVQIGSVAHVDFGGATLKDVSIADAKGADLSGCIIQNLTINGQLITKPGQLQELGISIDSATTVGISADKQAQIQLEIAREQAAEVGKEAVQNWQAQLNGTAQQAPASSGQQTGTTGDNETDAHARNEQTETVTLALNPQQAQSAQILPYPADAQRETGKDMGKNPDTQDIAAEHERARSGEKEQNPQLDMFAGTEQQQALAQQQALQQAEQQQALQLAQQQEQQQKQEAAQAKAPLIEMPQELQANERAVAQNANDNSTERGWENAKIQANTVQLAAVMWKDGQQQGQQTQEVEVQSGLKNNVAQQGNSAALG